MSENTPQEATPSQSCEVCNLSRAVARRK